MRPPDLIPLIREAFQVLQGVVHRTPLSRSRAFSRLSGAEAYLKLENLQKTGSFKVRGAYFKLSRLAAAGVRRCVAASSGNHAQGVAYSAGVLGVDATIFMPRYTPFTKVEATRGYGARVVLEGETYDDAYEAALRYSGETGAPLIHPFDDPEVIAGQGTIGVEIYEQLEDVDAVFVPVGGGGLISGIAAALKRLRPSVRVYGVQPEGSSAAARSLREGRVVELETVSTIADGVAVKKPGELTLSLMEELVDDILVVDDNLVAHALFLLLERAKLLAEPAGALGVAGLLSGQVGVEDRRAVAVVSGGNIDMAFLARLVERGLYVEGRQVRVRGVLPDKPGQLKRVVDVVAEMGLNIVGIRHERGNPLVNPGIAEVILEIEVPGRGVAEELVRRLGARGLDFRLAD